MDDQSAMTGPIGLPGLRLLPGYFDRPGQEDLLARVREIVAAAPLYRPTMPRTGKPYSVRMSNCGSLGWLSSKDGGYRYEARHPVTGAPWPPIPEALLRLWAEQSDYPAPPEACLINFYDSGARMGLHKDADEEALEAPVISVSLGDTAVFRVGGKTRKEPTRSMRLSSGDVVILGGAARHAYHGVDRIIAGTSSLLKDGGRVNLTLRRVTHPPTE